MNYLKKYFLRGVKENKGWMMVRPHLKKAVRFKRINLYRTETFPNGSFELVFCRNVLIYFLPGVREKVVEAFYKRLVPEGLIFLGHSESLFGMEDKFQLLGNCIYQKIAV
jgi:chemotaxis protein methyltransferase CheR